MTKVEFSIYDYDLPQNVAPVGEHVFEISNILLKKTRKAELSGSQDTVALFLLRIVEGYAKGCSINYHVNIKNDIKDVERMGRQEIRKIAHECDMEDRLDSTKDLSCLIGKRIGAVVEMDYRNDKKYKKITMIKNHKDITVATSPPAQLLQQSQKNQMDIEYEKSLLNDSIPF